jgi:hypothetical protein
VLASHWAGSLGHGMQLAAAGARLLLRYTRQPGAAAATGTPPARGQQQQQQDEEAPAGGSPSGLAGAAEGEAREVVAQLALLVELGGALYVAAEALAALPAALRPSTSRQLSAVMERFVVCSIKLDGRLEGVRLEGGRLGLPLVAAAAAVARRWRKPVPAAAACMVNWPCLPVSMGRPCVGRIQQRCAWTAAQAPGAPATRAEGCRRWRRHWRAPVSWWAPLRRQQRRQQQRRQQRQQGRQQGRQRGRQQAPRRSSRAALGAPASRRRSPGPQQLRLRLPLPGGALPQKQPGWPLARLCTSPCGSSAPSRTARASSSPAAASSSSSSSGGGGRRQPGRRGCRRPPQRSWQRWLASGYAQQQRRAWATWRPRRPRLRPGRCPRRPPSRWRRRSGAASPWLTLRGAQGLAWSRQQRAAPGAAAWPRSVNLGISASSQQLLLQQAPSTRTRRSRNSRRSRSSSSSPPRGGGSRPHWCARARAPSRRSKGRGKGGRRGPRTTRRLAAPLLRLPRPAAPARPRLGRLLTVQAAAAAA